MSEYLSEPKSLGERVKVELDLSSYATKADLKTGVLIHQNLLKSNFDTLDIDKVKMFQQI